MWRGGKMNAISVIPTKNQNKKFRCLLFKMFILFFKPVMTKYYVQMILQVDKNYFFLDAVRLEKEAG